MGKHWHGIRRFSDSRLSRFALGDEVEEVAAGVAVLDVRSDLAVELLSVLGAHVCSERSIAVINK